MKNIRTHLVLAGVVLLISACASQPKSTTLLDQVRIVDLDLGTHRAGDHGAAPQ